jgi:hypothetical protein
MVKMHNLKRTKADVAEEKKALGADRTGDVTHAYVTPEDEGARMEFEHHHLEKMGLGGNLKSGQEMEFHGRGTVEKSETRSEGGKERHSATIRFHKGGVDGEFKSGDGEERKALRSDIEKSHGASEEKVSSVKDAKKVPEKS